MIGPSTSPAPTGQDGEGMALSGPFEKNAEVYLNRSDWYGAPVPAGRIGPWGLGFTCWYYRVEVHGDRLYIAAETAEAALRAALAVVAPDIAAQAKRECAEMLARDIRTVLDQKVMHSHSRPGIWDADNRPGLADTGCEECAARERLADWLSQFNSPTP